MDSGKKVVWTVHVNLVDDSNNSYTLYFSTREKANTFMDKYTKKFPTHKYSYMFSVDTEEVDREFYFC
jgi:uncharacterized protein YpmS